MGKGGPGNELLEFQTSQLSAGAGRRLAYFEIRFCTAPQAKLAALSKAEEEVKKSHRSMSPRMSAEGGYFEHH